MPRTKSIGSPSGDAVAHISAPVDAAGQSANPAVTAFIEHWSKAEASERANAQSFIIGLTKILGVEPPSNDHADGYSFEHPVKLYSGHAETTGFVDLYKRGCFVLEAKQFVAQKEEQSDLELAAIEAGTAEAKKKSGPVRGTGSWDDAMIRARGQAERYVRSLPASEGNPPFVIVCDVGHSFEVYADFTQAGKAYLPFPDPRTFRIQLKDLVREDILKRLTLIWTNPAALDPAKVSADVTREIAGYLAELAKSLEKAGHAADVVAQFLTRCLFCMFAEDVGLLPERSFTDLLTSLPGDGTGFPDLVQQLFREMNTGTGKSISVVLRKKLLRFNGGLFADQTVLPVNGTQLGLLKKAAQQNWSNVEPAIFGTLLERALNPQERHKLGAHYTPRAYVERLVLPTVVEPLRAEWENVRAAAITHAGRGDLKAARKEVNAFHDRLCAVRVLDPACGSGNFLYVALQHLKILEGEILDVAAQFGENFKLELETHTVDPHQFLGIELNPRAASIAELVLWIGYLQWHFKLHGQSTPPEPILRAFKNIECRDAVLEYDGEPVPAKDEAGHEITVWDRRSMKTDFVTGRLVPDESIRVPLFIYANARPAEWPTSDFIIGNPPFIGKLKLRIDLGDGYAETLRDSYPDVPDSADFVMYWWRNAARGLLEGSVSRFGFISTSTIRQHFNRRVIENALEAGLSLKFVIPDHPWFDTSASDDKRAALRIAMTVAALGASPGEQMTVISEIPQPDGIPEVSFHAASGAIFADLTVGVDVTQTQPLQANDQLAGTGLILGNRGFVLDHQGVEDIVRQNPDAKHLIYKLFNGQDVNLDKREQFVIDTNGWTEEDLRNQLPEVFQLLLNTVYKERQANRDLKLRQQWWLFRRSNEQIRTAIAGLHRFIATVETSTHRIFVFLDEEIRPEHKLVVVGSDDAFVLGVLSSRLHVVYSIAAGGWRGKGNDPVYSKTRCFDPFPFPLCNEEEKGIIRKLAEELDAHRKQVQARHGLTLTGLYNVLEKLRAGEALTKTEKQIHEKGLVSILKQLHDDLDAAVFAAYRWPATLTDAEILERLVALNAERAAEEKRGIIHWLRPDYQKPKAGGGDKQTTFELPAKKGRKIKATKAKSSKRKLEWPKPLAERIRVTETVLHACPAPVNSAELAQRFSRARAKDVQEILETLVTLGRAHASGGRFTS